MNRRPTTLIVALVAVVAVAGGALALTAAQRSGVAFNPRSPAASEPGATHVVTETHLASDDEARVFARENAAALAHWIALPPGGLFYVSPSADVTVTALGDGNTPSWAGTWTVTVASREVPAFKQAYTQSMTFGPGAASQPTPRPHEGGGLADPALYQHLGALPKAERIALLGFIAGRGNPTLHGLDRLSVEIGRASGLSDSERFFRDRLLAYGIARGFAPTRVLWLPFDDPSAPDGTPFSLLVGYSAKRHGWIVLASAHGTYEGKLVTAQ